MKTDKIVSDRQIEKLAKKISKSFAIEQEEALGLVYEEWDRVEALFRAHSKVKAVYSHLIEEIDYTYRIA